MWDVLFWSDAQTTTGSNLLLGAEYAGGFWITGGGLSSATTSDNMIYKLDATGALVASWPQPDVGSGWGFRDPAFDGTYMYYGCEAGFIYAYDLNGNPVPSFNIPKPSALAIARALAYDPNTDHFFSGNFGSNLVEFDRSGNVIWQGSPSPLAAVYGMCYDDNTGRMWIYDQGSSQCVFHEWNQVTHTFTGVSHIMSLIGPSTSQIAGGCGFTSEWNPSYWTIVAMLQGTPNDLVYVVEMYLALDPLAPAAPTNFTVSNNGATLTASLAWTNPTTTINGQPLASIDSVIVKRGDTVVATLTGSPGQAMTYNDNVPSVGMYNYQVYCTNSYGDGQPANASAWIGLDVPGPVTNLTGAGVGTTLVAELNWTNPTAGAHGGYWPAGSITGYVINRYGPSNATFNITGITTTYTDNTIPVQGWYHYGVIAVNQSGNGPEVMTGNFYVGPPEFASIPYNWVEISGVGTNTGITGDDQNLGPFPIGFGYNHYGTTFTDIRVCSNGWASFTSTSTAYTNAAIPNTAEPNNLVAPLWDDLYPPGGGVIYYYYDQANSRFIIEWDNVMSYVTPRTPQKFEVILYPNGDMDFMYHTIQAPCVNANTVGKENAGGTVGVQVTYNGSGPLEPASNTGIRIYGAPPVTPNVTITLTPINPPIQIPATGGSFNFDVNVANGESTVQSFAAWIMVQLPNMNWYGPVLGPINLTLPGGASITRNRSQTVPASAPAGNYLYEGRVGVYPATIWDTGSFPFTKLSTGDGTPVTGWENTGESFDQMTTVSAPSEFVMIGAYPNPFNPSTTISFALPTASRVTLNVYDISGRQVATLANGWRDAGVHEVVFDGSNLASGIYIYTLTAGDQSFTGKMVMMK
jgi:hypothetical protein